MDQTLAAGMSKMASRKVTNDLKIELESKNLKRFTEERSVSETYNPGPCLATTEISTSMA